MSDVPPDAPAGTHVGLWAQTAARPYWCQRCGSSWPIGEHERFVAHLRGEELREDLLARARRLQDVQQGVRATWRGAAHA